MKKLFTLVLAIIITLSIVACGNNLDKQPLEEPKDEQTAGKQEQSTENSNVEELLVEQSKVEMHLLKDTIQQPPPLLPMLLKLISQTRKADTIEQSSDLDHLRALLLKQVKSEILSLI